MAMDHARYKYEYRCYYWVNSWRHSYEVVGRYGGLQFHVSEYDGRYSAGLELHYLQPQHYMQDRPHNQHCWLLKAPCWHDGTTLYAEENILPYFDGKNHDMVFRLLTGFANDKFYPFDDTEEPTQESEVEA